MERPGLQQALAQARAKRYDMLLVYRVDRLSRSGRGLAQVLEELHHAGVSFRSATEPFDSGTAGVQSREPRQHHPDRGYRVGCSAGNL